MTQSDAEEIERQFQKELEGDLSNLRTELGVARYKLIFSNETGIAVFAAAGSFVERIARVASNTKQPAARPSKEGRCRGYIFTRKIPW